MHPMRMSWTDRRWNPLVAVLILLLVWACGDDGDGCDGADLGCDGCGDGEGSAGPPYVFPDDGPIVPQGVQVRVSQYGLSFIEENFDQIIALVLDDEGDGGLTFCVPNEGAVGFSICPNPGTCSDGGTGCDVDIILEDLVINPRDPQSAAESGRLEVELVVSTTNIPWRPLLGTCQARLREMPIKAVITFNVDAPPHERVHIRIPTDELDFEVRTRYLNLNAGGSIGCAIVGGLAGFFVNLLSGTIGNLIVDPVQEAVEGFTCVTCEDAPDCPAGSRCDEGICRLDGTDDCVQADLGLETEFDLGGLLADFAPGLDARLGILAYLAGYADTADGGGIDLSAQTGFASNPNLCVPYREPPSTRRVMKSSVLHGERTPMGFDFAVGLGLSKSSLDLALWAAYNSGVLCLSIGADEVEQLTTSLFALLLQSVGEVTQGANLPLLLQLAPNQPPHVTIGEGTIDRSGSQPVIVDPLLNITIPDLDLHFYTWLHDRWVRLFALNVDIDVPLGLDVDEDNNIIPVLGDLDDLLSRIEPRAGELIRQSDLDSLADLLPGLISGLAGPLLGDLTEGFEIPDLAGFELVLNDDSFTGVEFDAELESHRLLGVFADLRLASSAMMMPHMTRIRQVDAWIPTADEIRVAVAEARSADESVPVERWQPRVTLHVDAERSDGTILPDVEMSWRIGGGFWSIWHHAHPLEVRDPRLRLEGRHAIEVRTRPAGGGNASVTNDTVEVVVDWTPPTIELEALDGMLRVHARDNLHSEAELTMRVATDDRPWGTWSTIDDVLVAESAERARVQVRDPAGNVAEAEVELKRATEGPALTGGASGPSAASDAAGRTGCSASGAAPGGWPVALLLPFGLLILARRRRLLGVFAALLLALGVAGCGDKGSKSGGPEPPECDEENPCPTGEICEDEVCVAVETEPEPCADTDQCEAGLVCVSGECVALACEDAAACAGVSCADGTSPYCGADGCYCGGCSAACGEGAWCCAATGQCADLPDPCAGTTCPTGQRPDITRQASFDTGLCDETDPGACECVDLDPLPLGQFGFFLDAAASPDGSHVLLSARSRTYRDLMIGFFDGGDTIDWTFVDGLPDGGNVTGALDGPRGGIATPGGDAGEHSSITIGADGAAHVAYSVSRSGAPRATLRYARGAGERLDREWTFVDVDEDGFTGRYTRTLIDPDGHPVILYSAMRLRDAERLVWTSELRMARASTPSPTDSADFTRTVLHRVDHVEPCAGRCTASADSCRLDLQLCQPTLRRGCDPSCGDEEACFDTEVAADPDNPGSDVATEPRCAPVASFPSFERPVVGTGMYPSAAWLSDGRMVITFYDGIHGNLLAIDLAADAAGNGEEPGNDAPEGLPEARILDGEELRDGEVVDLGDVGRFAHLFVDADDNVYIAYIDSTLAELRVFDLTAGTISTVDDGIRIDGDSVAISRVGEDARIREVGGRLFVTYHDTTQHALLESRLEGDGWTEPSVVASRFNGDEYDGAQGFFARHVQTASGRFVFHHRMNLRASPIVRDVVVSPR
ncbi:MAG: hypothetical protein EA398_03240 [Deltaproteobacteria bacterium]|nr:MAG: hypothetical protein EA398_03240 [Deltaproteobacteria bacterium]